MERATNGSAPAVCPQTPEAFERGLKRLESLLAES
jgi:hypothetical protein